MRNYREECFDVGTDEDDGKSPKTIDDRKNNGSIEMEPIQDKPVLSFNNRTLSKRIPFDEVFKVRRPKDLEVCNSFVSQWSVCRLTGQLILDTELDVFAVNLARRVFGREV